MVYAVVIDSIDDDSGERFHGCTGHWRIKEYAEQQTVLFSTFPDTNYIKIIEIQGDSCSECGKDFTKPCPGCFGPCGFCEVEEAR
jgi:hypothetical protein